jgi:Flp pilus assembly protein TadD
LHRRKARDAAAYFAAARRLDPNYAPAVLNEAILYHHYIVNKTNALARYREYLSMRPDAAGAAAATESERALEAELYPKPLVVATNAPMTTNRVVAALTNAPTNRVALVGTNQARTNLAHTTKPTNTVVTNRTVVMVTPPPTNKVVVTPTNALPEKITAIAITNTPPPAPEPKTNLVLTVTNAPPIIENPVNPQREKAKEKEPVKEPEPIKPLEVVNVDEEPVIIAPAKDIAPPKTETPKTNKPVQVAVVPKVPEAPVTKPEEPAPLIRPVQREEKEKSTILKKVNPLNWFKRGEKEKEAETKTEIVVKKPEAPKSTKAIDLASLPEPPPETKPAPPPPEPVFARYPYRTTPLPPAGNRAAAMTPFNTAIQAHQEGKLGKAMDSYREAIRLDPRFFEAHLNLGIAAAAANDLSLALAAFEDSVRLDPKSAEARYQFAMALRRANYPQDAVNELKALLDETPNEARAHLALGNLYAQVMNKPEAAASNYQKALELNPQMPQAAQVRAWLAQH